MTCIKTGADVWLAQHNCYVHCDAHEFADGEVLLLRTTGHRYYEGPMPCQYTVWEIAEWFDPTQRGTLITTNFTYHSYEGVIV